MENDYSNIEPTFRGQRSDLQLLAGYFAGLIDGGIDLNDVENHPQAPAWIYPALRRLMSLSADLVIRRDRFEGIPLDRGDVDAYYSKENIWHRAYICLDFHLGNTFRQMSDNRYERFNKIGYPENLLTGSWSYRLVLQATHTIFEKEPPCTVPYTAEEIRKLDEAIAAEAASKAAWLEMENIQGPPVPLPNFD